MTIVGFVTEALTPCETHPLIDWFAEPDSVDSAAASLLCQQCPVENLCLISAMDHQEPWGVWGGRQFPLCRNGHTVTAENTAHRPTRAMPDRTVCLSCESAARRRQRNAKRLSGVSS